MKRFSPDDFIAVVIIGVVLLGMATLNVQGAVWAWQEGNVLWWVITGGIADVLFVAGWIGIRGTKHGRKSKARGRAG